MVPPMSRSAQDPKQPASPFGEVENKSLEGVVEETKTADPEGKPAEAEADAEKAQPQTSRTVSVVMVHHYLFDGKNLLPGETVELPAHVAETLIQSHRAKKA